MSKTKWSERPADFQFLVDSGLLFEINRTVLHLFGLALAIERDQKTGQLRLASQLKDNREHPEALTYDANTWELGRMKLEKFMEEFGNGQIEKRDDALGWGCQHFSPKKPK